MNIKEKITAFVKAKNPKKDVQNIRGLVKTGENSWSFTFTFIKDDSLSMSRLHEVELDESTGKISYVRKIMGKKQLKKVYA